MFKALAQLWAALEMLFQALYNTASSLNNLSIVGDIATEAMKDEKLAERLKVLQAYPAPMRKEMQALEDSRVKKIAAIGA